MTEISRPWAGTTVGDAGPYSAGNWWDAWQSMMGGSGALAGAGSKGVLFGVPGQLRVSYVAANTLHVEAGAAMVDGLFYRNDAVFSATVSSATAGNVRDDRLVIRKYFSGLIQTARIALVAGSEAASPGPGTPPALTQDTSRQTYWDLPLARVSITDAGIITVTDEREFVGGEAGMVKIAEVTISPVDATYTFTNIPQGFKHLKLMASGRNPDDGGAIFNQIYLQCNGDVGANYNNILAQFYTGAGNYFWSVTTGDTRMETGILLPSVLAIPNTVAIGGGEVTLFDYSNPTRYKTGMSLGGVYTSTFPTLVFAWSTWDSIVPITSIKVFCDSDGDAHPELQVGSVVTLYGIT